MDDDLDLIAQFAWCTFIVINNVFEGEIFPTEGQQVLIQNYVNQHETHIIK